MFLAKARYHDTIYTVNWVPLIKILLVTELFNITFNKFDETLQLLVTIELLFGRTQGICVGILTVYENYKF